MSVSAARAGLLYALCLEQCLAHSWCSGDLMTRGPRDVAVLEHKSTSGNYWVIAPLCWAYIPLLYRNQDYVQP